MSVFLKIRLWGLQLGSFLLGCTPAVYTTSEKLCIYYNMYQPKIAGP
jgi:hypothetical protein